jgi:hypothetical protein
MTKLIVDELTVKLAICRMFNITYFLLPACGRKTRIEADVEISFDFSEKAVNNG